jgi:hypothetical protein
VLRRVLRRLPSLYRAMSQFKNLIELNVLYCTRLETEN